MSESATKSMATIFWYCDGILLIDYKEKGTRITERYCATILEKLKGAMKEKRRGKFSKGVVLLIDNALHKSGFESAIFIYFQI